MNGLLSLSLLGGKFNLAINKLESDAHRLLTNQSKRERAETNTRVQKERREMNASEATNSSRDCFDGCDGSSFSWLIINIVMTNQAQTGTAGRNKSSVASNEE